MTGRHFRLATKINPVSWVDAGSYPAAGGCHLVCLSERQCAIIRDMVYPMALQPTRFAKRVHGDIFETGDETILQEHLVEVHDLLYQIGEGSSVACTELVSALTDLAAAVAAGGGGSGCQTVVNCGSGGSGTTNIINQLGGLEVEDFLPAAPLDAPSESGPPPTGFDDWAAYRVYKCQAAHVIFDRMVAFLDTMQTLSGVAAYMALATPAAILLLGASGPAAPVVAGAELIAAIVAFLVLAGSIRYTVAPAKEYLVDNKDIIVCAMFHSGSAANALSQIAGFFDDAIQTIEWGAVLGPLGSELSALLGTAAAAAVPNGLVNSLFQLAIDIQYPDATCVCAAAFAWHYPDDAEGWVHSDGPVEGWTATHGWTEEAANRDESDPSAGRLRHAHQRVSGITGYAQEWTYTFVGVQPVAVTGMHLAARVYSDNAESSATQVQIWYSDDTADGDDQANQTGWLTSTATVSAGNDGKLIDHLILRGLTGEGTNGSAHVFAFDNVVLG